MSRSPLASHSSTPAELQERLAADAALQPYLLYRDADDRQRIVALDGSRTRVTVGRAEDADIPLSWDAAVSRTHALIERIHDEWVLVDDGLSSNGSFVNGERVSGRRRLVPDDILRFGSVQVAFRAPGGQARGTVPAPDWPGPADLTEAQRRVLVALCRPYREGTRFARPATNQEIAQELFLSVEAVRTHLRTLFAKLGVEDLARTDKRRRLVERAFATGIVSDRDL